MLGFATTVTAMNSKQIKFSAEVSCRIYISRCYHGYAKYHLHPHPNPHTELSMGYSFSQRNGMGPMPVIPPAAVDVEEPPQLTAARELRQLLSTLTSAEEAAIRQICPMISIVRLGQGNLAAKGNTSCVWQRSRLNLVLQICQ